MLKKEKVEELFKVLSSEGDFDLKDISVENDFAPATSLPYNTIFFGIPGSGKSYYIEHKILFELGIDVNKDVDRYERVTFYPEYTYSDFVGTYKFKGNGIVKCDGPFTRILKEAQRALDSGKKTNYALIIEELNRGNAEAIFGDIFQLLDRPNGESEYAISNDFINEDKKIKLPKNLYIIATINTSDQNVFNLDTAFGRRWEYIRFDDEFSVSQDEGSIYQNYKIKGFDNIKWNDFRTEINKEILKLDLWSKEDKQLGLYYINKLDDSLDEEEARRKFVNKVVRYLWFDVFRNDISSLISVLEKTLEISLAETNSFDNLSKQIINKGKNVNE